MSDEERKQVFMVIDPRRLPVLVAVAATGSVTAAADRLHLTGPAVSQQLRALERETGLTLLDRSGRRVVPTAAGRLLASYGERVDAVLREAEGALAELTGRVSGPVRLAAFQSVMRPLVAPVVRELAAQHPAIALSVVERHGPQVLADVRRSELDLALTEYDTGSPPPELDGDLSRVRLALDPYRLVVPPDWPRTARGVADLRGRPWVAGPPGTACDQALGRLAAEAGIEVRAVDVCVEFSSVLALVAAGRGAAVVPAATLGDETVNVCAADDLGGRQLAVVRRAGPGEPVPAVRAVLDLLRAHAAEWTPGRRGDGRSTAPPTSQAVPAVRPHPTRVGDEVDRGVRG